MAKKQKTVKKKTAKKKASKKKNSKKKPYKRATKKEVADLLGENLKLSTKIIDLEAKNKGLKEETLEYGEILKEQAKARAEAESERDENEKEIKRLRRTLLFEEIKSKKYLEMLRNQIDYRAEDAGQDTIDFYSKMERDIKSKVKKLFKKLHAPKIDISPGAESGTFEISIPLEALPGHLELNQCDDKAQ